MSTVSHPLPYPDPEYDERNEAQTRRQIEQNLQDILNNLDRLKRIDDPDASGSTRRYAFTSSLTGITTYG